jgi:hypothetical protein
MKIVELLKKMDFNFNVEVTNESELMGVIIKEIVMNIPKVQEDFIELLNEVAGTEFTIESDTFEIISKLKELGKDLTVAFTQALKLKSMI